MGRGGQTPGGGVKRPGSCADSMLSPLRAAGYKLLADTSQTIERRRYGMARSYKVEGTNDFLVAAVILAGLGVWAVKDGWFPSAKVLERHPREVAVAAPFDGVVVDVAAVAGKSVGTNHVVARIRPAGTPGAAEPPSIVDLRPGPLGAGTEGTIMEVRRTRHDPVKQGDPIVLIAPDEHFYPFNKSLSVFSLLGAIVCVFIHRAVK